MFADKNKDGGNWQSEPDMCIICGEISPFSEVHPPKDRQSWAVLYNAALIKKFEPITKLRDISDELLFTIKYHRRCRANFTNIKALRKLDTKGSSSRVSSDNETPCLSKPPEKRLKREITGLRQSTYTRICIFCDKENKYKKGSRSREPLIQVLELGTDKKLREMAIERGDKKIIAVTSRDIVAAEACYHKSCYLAYTRVRPDKIKNVDEYIVIENLAYDKLYDFIREDIFLNPRVESQSFLLAKLISYLKDDVDEISDSTKKNFRYNLSKEFGSSLQFFKIDGKIYAVPDNFTYDLLLSDYVRTKNTLEEYLTSKTKTDPIPEAAKKIRDDLKSLEKPQVWPPSPHELHMNYIAISPSLINFLHILIGDSAPRSLVVAWSIAQDIVYAVFKGTILTPKHVLLQMTCKTLTGNVQLISILNRLGHGCSYSKLLEIDTALCIQKLNTVSEGEIPLPTSIHVSIPTVLAYDNIDRTEETLSGAGTSHRVNGIIIQQTSSTCLPQRSGNKNIKGKQRSILMTNPCIEDYIVGKRKNPPAVTTVELPHEYIEHIREARQKNFLWIFSRLHNEQCQTVCSWTGFNILIRNDVAIEADTVAYLPCINKPATNMSTVHEILRQSLQIKSQLQLGEVTLVLDQAIFSKAMEIAWCHPQTFKDVFIMMGGFHIICNLLSIIGKLFGDAGLGDIAVEIGCIAQGSIQNVLQGKQYNRGIRLHKCIFEALMRIIYRKFLDHLKTNFPEVFSEMEDFDILVQQFCDNMCNDTFKSAIADSRIIKVMELFDNYLCYLRNENGPLSSFWMTYIDMVELLLGVIRSNREGNWLLFMACIQQLIPWCFAMDKVNYARYLSVNYADMSNLAETHPEISKHLIDGGFSVQLGCHNPFSRIPVDQTLEETVNKDTQTSGGTKGFSLNKGAVEKYYITAEYRASALRQLRENLNVTSTFSHSDLHAPRIKMDELCVSSAVQLLENEWTNPFDTNPSDIVGLSTGRAVPSDIQSSLLNVRRKGDEAYERFKKDRLEKGEGFFEPIKRINLKTFTATATSKKSGKNKDVIIKSDRKLFASMILIAENRRLNMHEVFSHPLGPLPWSISNPDGSLKKTMKAVLGKHLESLVSPSEGNIYPSATIIDGMALIQKLHGENTTFDQLSDAILNQVLNTAYCSSRIDVVFDTYKDKSIKCAERRSRGSDAGILFKNIKSGHRIIKWKCLLQSGESKNNLIKFLADSWREKSNRIKIGNKTLYVTHSTKCIKITGSGFHQVSKLASSQEEADSRMMLHIRDAAIEFPNVICVSDDTDVLVLAIYISSDINVESNLYMKRGSSGRIRLIDIKKLASVVGCNMKSALPGLHAWTGCDTVSAFSGQGKLKALKLLQNNKEFSLLFSRLGSEFKLSNSDHNLIQKFTSHLYSRNTKIENINELRYHIFKSRQGQVDSAQLPPCEDCLTQHSKRANYQAAIWKRCLVNFPDIPQPEDHGWILGEDGELHIKWMTGAPAPEAVLELLSCSCLKSCQLPTCTCMVNNLKCTNVCRLLNCENTTTEQEEDLVDSNLTEPFESDEEDEF